MTKKQKKALTRIIAAALCMVAIWLAGKLLPDLSSWLNFAYLIPYLIVGYDVLAEAVEGIRNGDVFDENFLMAVATVGAIALGEFQEGVAVMFFYQVGELFQSYAVGRSRKSIADLMDIKPETANLVLEDGSVSEEDPEDVPEGSLILVRPGEKVPIDGVVEEGESVLDTAALTGESRPVSVKTGDSVFSGSVNASGVLKVRTTKCYEDSTVARILELVENSSMKKARTEAFITRFARYYTPAVCCCAAALALIPSLVTGDWRTWVFRALTFLVISCPCALVISIPLSFFGGIGGASRSGILVKGGNDLEALSKLECLLLDKTGTVTEGNFRIIETVSEGETDPKAILSLAALAESYSTHPIAQLIREGAGEHAGGKLGTVKEIAGQGVVAEIDGKTVAVGNEKLMRSVKAEFRPLDGIGTKVYVERDGQYLGCIRIADEVKAGSRQAIRELEELGIRSVLLSGDSKSAVLEVAEAVGIRNAHGELLPEDKVTHLEKMLSEKQSENSMIGFVGDGINDAPVLMRSDVGIAMGALGSDAAIEAADVVLMDDNLRKLPLAVRISQKCMRIVWENIIFSLFVKALCLLFAALGYANMWWAVFADVGVMVIAVLNATRMLRPIKLEE